MATTHDYLEKCASLAVMGGTFDPIHNGHLAVAEAVRHALKPQRVLFIPGGQPPHKQAQPVAHAEHRYNMVLAAVSEYPAFDVSKMEITREGNSYTADTIAALREIVPPHCEIHFIIGADAIMEILTWNNADKLLKLCKFAAVKRPGYELDTAFLENLRKNYGAEITVIDGPSLEISGTAVRESFAEGKPVGGIIPRATESYARRNALYSTLGTELSEERFDAIQAELKTRLSERRYTHTLGTVIEAEKLAKHYGADTVKARWAALLHDCAKEYSADKKRALCKAWGIKICDAFDAHIDAAHGIIGAESARRDYFVADEEILQAIRYHTVGHAKMTLLDKIIMLADYIEPYREDYHPLQEIRRFAYTDINAALITGLAATNDEVKQRGHIVHKNSKAALKILKKG